jgi:hypothetical protein
MLSFDEASQVLFRCCLSLVSALVKLLASSKAILDKSVKRSLERFLKFS